MTRLFVVAGVSELGSPGVLRGRCEDYDRLFNNRKSFITSLGPYAFIG